MCARVQSDVLRVLRVLRGPVFQFCTCLWRHVFGVLCVLCVLLGLYVLYALCALYAFSKPYVQHRGPQKRASGQKRTDGSQRNIVDDWIEATRLNGRDGTLGPCIDPPGMPARVEEILRQPSRAIGNLTFPNDGMLVVYLLQQGNQPYRTYWGYSERTLTRVAQHNSNAPKATKYTRGRTD